jgi:4'-phosphopantetheinyl transferase
MNNSQVEFAVDGGNLPGVHPSVSDWSSQWPATRLDADSIHVWRLTIPDDSPLGMDRLEWLSADEHERAGRLVRPLDRHRFVARRVILRLLLATYTGLAPHRLWFQVGPRGKPELIPALGTERLHFNVSHSAGMALYAVSRQGPVGVDVEQVVPIPEMSAMIEECFALSEQHQLNQLPAPVRLHRFYRSWTCKEAVLKALGEGITDGLHRVEVGLGPRWVPFIRSIAGRSPTERWMVASLQPARGFLGAVAKPGEAVLVQCGQIDLGGSPTSGEPIRA